MESMQSFLILNPRKLSVSFVAIKAQKLLAGTGTWNNGINRLMHPTSIVLDDNIRPPHNLQRKPGKAYCLFECEEKRTQRQDGRYPSNGDSIFNVSRNCEDLRTINCIYCKICGNSTSSWIWEGRIAVALRHWLQSGYPPNSTELF